MMILSGYVYPDTGVPNLYWSRCTCSECGAMEKVSYRLPSPMSKQEVAERLTDALNSKGCSRCKKTAVPRINHIRSIAAHIEQSESDVQEAFKTFAATRYEIDAVTVVQTVIDYLAANYYLREGVIQNAGAYTSTDRYALKGMQQLQENHYLHEGVTRNETDPKSTDLYTSMQRLLGPALKGSSVKPTDNI